MKRLYIKKKHFKHLYPSPLVCYLKPVACREFCLVKKIESEHHINIYTVVVKRSAHFFIHPLTFKVYLAPPLVALEGIDHLSRGC